MSYAVQHPAAAAPAPAAPPRRPASVGIASALLIVMAVVGLAYAVATLAIAPGTVDRFRAAAGESPDVDGFVTVVWIGAAVGAVLAVILFALYVVLALGLRRGSNGIRIATLVVCVLGLVAGCASTLTVAVQRGGDSAAGSTGAALADAYPGSWIAVNIGLGVAQMAGYVLVGVLLLAAPRSFFGRAPKPAPADPYAAPQPGYAGAGGYGAPGGYPAGGYGVPGPHAAPQGGYAAQPMYGAPYPGGPAPVAENPGEPSPWAPPRPTTPVAPLPSHPPASASPPAPSELPGAPAAPAPSELPGAPASTGHESVAPGQGAVAAGQWPGTHNPSPSVPPSGEPTATGSPWTTPPAAPSPEASGDAPTAQDPNEGSSERPAG